MTVPKLTWTQYPVGTLLKITEHKYVLRVAKSVSDLEPEEKKIFSDHKLTLLGYYNQRGYCVGYCILFKGKPSIIADSFYLLLDYVEKGEKPKDMVFPKLLGKEDSSIRLVKFGKLTKNRMYVFIYRRKQDGRG
jgi:hypothetical protein